MHSKSALSPDFIEVAASLASLARPLALRHFRQPLKVERKGDASPVTIADRQIEALLREHLRTRFPDHGILGEEYGAEQLTSRFIWALDPIDGTKSFITGMPTFGTLVALLDHLRPSLGVIDMPALDERWVGGAGFPTTFNGRPCRTRSGVALGDAVLYSTSPEQFAGADRSCIGALSAAVGLHRWGGDCYAYGLLASGHIDAVAEAGLQPYDFLALVPVIDGAGGVITDWQGRALQIESDGRVLAAATPELHAQMLRVVGA